MAKNTINYVLAFKLADKDESFTHAEARAQKYGNGTTVSTSDSVGGYGEIGQALYDNGARLYSEANSAEDAQEWAEMLDIGLLVPVSAIWIEVDTSKSDVVSKTEVLDRLYEARDKANSLRTGFEGDETDKELDQIMADLNVVIDWLAADPSEGVD